MEELYLGLIKKIGEDPTREGLLKTPHRASKAMRFLTSGYQQDLDKIVNGAIFKEESNDIVVIKNVEFYSLCEHHILPFFGTCNVAYIPNGKIIGISKIPRIVDMFARRLQVQERLTNEIATTIGELLGAKGVIVSMRAKHMCMSMRGVEKQFSETVTRSIYGDIPNDIINRISDIL